VKKDMVKHSVHKKKALAELEVKNARRQGLKASYKKSRDGWTVYTHR